MKGGNKEVNSNQVTCLRCQFTSEYTRSAGSICTRALIQGVKFTSVEQFKKMIMGGGDDGSKDDSENNNGGNTVVIQVKHRIRQLDRNDCLVY